MTDLPTHQHDNDDGNLILHEAKEEYRGSSIKNRVNHVVSKIALKGANDEAHNSMLKAIFLSFYKKVEELYDEYILSKSKPADKAQMILYTNQMDHPISTPLRMASDLTPNHMMAAVSRAQNSGVSISLRDNIMIEFLHIRIDPEWNEPEDSFPGGRGHLNLLYFGQHLKKHSIVQVGNENDNLCLAKAVIIGKALLESRKKSSPSQEKLFLKRYKQLSRKSNNNKALQLEVEKLYKAAHVPFKEMPDLNLLQKFEEVLNICVKVVSLNHQSTIIYKGGKERNNMIYLCFYEDSKTGRGHYCLISNIRGFFAKQYYCMYCDVAYNNMYDHRCYDVQNWCFACYSRGCKPSKNCLACPSCNISLQSASCEKRHKQLKCFNKWKCPKCQMKFPRYLNGEALKSDVEMELSHDCSLYFCRECNDNVPDDHLCFIKRKRLKDSSCKLMFFDFETDQSTGVHQVNFVYARYFVPFNDAATFSADYRSWQGDWIDVNFKGLDALGKFLAFLTKDRKKFHGYTVIAHNLKGFDGVFILKTLVENGVCPDIIVKGQKIMCMTILNTPRIRFIDSFNFLPMGLAKLPGAFGLNCGSKGYFPHFFNRPENWFYVGELPDEKYYGIDFMPDVERNKFFEWYNHQKANEVVFNFQQELESYCKQDVCILFESCMAYRKVMMEETGCDPFAYLTCASVCNAVYRANFMPENTIARVPPGGYKQSRYSDESLEWLEYIKNYCGYPDLRHIGNSAFGEKQIGKYFVDGFDENTKTVFEYNGCFFHGCPKCFPSGNLRNTITQKLLTQCFKETVERQQELEKMGFNVISIWGCEWKFQKIDPTVAEKVNKLSITKPLKPRDAFFGGRTETFKLYWDKTPIAFDDVTSLYPWVNFTQRYPIGHPQIKFYGIENVDDFFGFIKCSILPPRNLYLPVLPMHAGIKKKLLFALCRTCAESFQIEQCEHTEDQRALVGTWFTEEVKLAITKGYKILKTFCVWHFEQSSESLFADYVKTFYKKKLLSSKLPFTSEEEIQKYIKDVSEKENIIISGTDQFLENPGLRQLTKLMLNNLWGRFGMQENISRSVLISSFEKLLKMVNDETLEIQGVRVVSKCVVQVIYRVKNVQFLEMSKDTNIFIAATTTAWARIRLYKELDQLKDRVLYCDTDSVIYQKSLDPEKNLKIGNFLGDMTSELDSGDEIIEFVSGGPKNYAYKTRKGKIVVKVKGFSLNSVNAPVFSFENIKKIILEGVSTKKDGRVIPPSEKVRKITLEGNRNLLFARHIQNPEQASAIATNVGISVYSPSRIIRTRDWNMLKKPEQKLYSFCFDKRIVLSDLNTVPYGYID